MLGDGAAVNILYANCWEWMNLNENHLIVNDATISGSKGTCMKPAHRVFLIVDFARIVVRTELFMMESLTPQNGLFRPTLDASNEGCGISSMSEIPF